MIQLEDDVELIPEELLKILLSAAGGLIGLEREFRDKAVCHWTVSSPRKAHDQLIKELFNDQEIEEIRY